MKYEGLSEDGINDLADQLRQFARSEYIEMCISNKYEGEDDGVVKEESEVWFDYIYENEEYPEWKSAKRITLKLNSKRSPVQGHTLHMD